MILVVDEDDDTRLAYAGWLARAGYRTLIAEDAVTALWLAHRVPPDAAVIGGDDGNGLVGHLLEHGSPTGLVFTGSSRETTSLPASVPCEIVHPACASDLVGAVRRALALRWAAFYDARRDIPVTVPCW